MGIVHHDEQLAVIDLHIISCITKTLHDIRIVVSIYIPDIRRSAEIEKVQLSLVAANVAFIEHIKSNRIRSWFRRCIHDFIIRWCNVSSGINRDLILAAGSSGRNSKSQHQCRPAKKVKCSLHTYK